jgi:alkylation response protein AidB-like acyl-CoA dehydrogenase
MALASKKIKSECDFMSPAIDTEIREIQFRPAEKSDCRAIASLVGLESTTRIFEVMGARSTAASYGFDRYWRDLRTFTLHDPVGYKLRYIGNWVLNQELQMVTPYS